MSTAQSLIDQQLGLAKWRNFDQAMVRLRCPESEEYKQIWQVDENVSPVDSPIFACKFANKEGCEHILALANEDGRLAIHDTTNRKERYGKQVHHNAIFDLAWMFGRMKLVTVSGDHTSRLVDVGNGDMRVEQMFGGHTRSVKTIAIKQNDSSVFATGSRDGSILVWDIRSSLSYYFVSTPDRVIQNAHFAKTALTPTSKRKLPVSINPYISGANSVTGLAFQDENTLVSCSAGDGTIKVWDLRKSYKNCKKEPCPKSVLSYSGNTTRCGFSNLIFDKDCIKLYANCLDHIIYCYNMSTYNSTPVMKYTGHLNNTFYVKSCLSSDGLYLLSGSSDQNAYIWNTNSPEPLVKLKGHNAEVTCVAWCQNIDQAIVTCSDDMRHKIWRIGPEILPDNWEVIGRGTAQTVALPTLKRTRHFECPNQAKKPKCCTSCGYADEKYCSSCGASPDTNKRLATDILHGEPKRLCPNQQGLRSLTPDKEIKPDRKHKRTEEEKETHLKRMKVVDETSFNECVKTNTDKPNILPKVCDIFNEHDGESTEINKAEALASNGEFSPRSESPDLSDLPNFVVDGYAPHLNYSPEKRSEKDWLTKLRIEKSLIREMEELTSSPSSKVPKHAGNNSPRGASLKKQHKTRRCGSPQSSLLKFFRVTNNSIIKDSQCISKASISQLH